MPTISPFITSPSRIPPEDRPPLNRAGTQIPTLPSRTIILPTILDPVTSVLGRTTSKEVSTVPLPSQPSQSSDLPASSDAGISGNPQAVVETSPSSPTGVAPATTQGQGSTVNPGRTVISPSPPPSSTGARNVPQENTSTHGPTVAQGSSAKHASSATQGSSISQAIGTESPRMPAPSSPSTASGHPSPVSNLHRSKLPTGAILGLVLSLSLAVGLISLYIAARLRRRRTLAASESQTVSPFMRLLSSSDLPRTGANQLRLQYLEKELNAAQTKMQEIRSQGTGGTPIGPPVEEAADTERVRIRDEEIAVLRGRISELEAQMRSPWALGLSDEPPPGYTA
ncbi:hypothetical protein DFH09DRAFT_1134714 [Mycena vulgaris]|nr:hypothetical protein DFH09DRAFT_1134714 [Mycena vulgaris]